jgi:bifunctional non-homologous end joining protein LigD
MGLKEYREKRDFTKSPEPAGSEETATARKGGRERFFCVQKHLATALHYDLRLEHDGVLMSWAVPKGPAIDPSVKRLAMHVEDHPIEYGTFEGVIPEGYGAGVVMLWDVGTWTPEVDDVGAALKKGDLKFTLNGFKLKGSWVLVRTRGWGGGGGSKGGEKSGGDSSGRSWLLIKHRDDWAGPIDIAAFAPLSVKSEQNFRGILTQQNPGIWHSNRAAAGMTGDAAMAKIVEKVIALEEEEGRAPEAAPAKASAAKIPAAKAKAKATSDDVDDDEAPPAAPAKAAPAKSRSKAAGAVKPATPARTAAKRTGAAKRGISTAPARAEKKR